MAARMFSALRQAIRSMDDLVEAILNRYGWTAALPPDPVPIREPQPSGDEAVRELEELRWRWDDARAYIADLEAQLGLGNNEKPANRGTF